MSQKSYYSERYLHHMKAANCLSPEEGPSWAFDGMGLMQGPRLRTSITFWVSLGPDKEILNIAWRGKGVPEAVPSASAISSYILSEKLKAMDAASLGLDVVSRCLDGLPQRREDAALRTLQALRRALYDANAIDLPDSDEELDQEMACHCVGVRFTDLRVLAATGIDSLALQRRTAFGTGCGTCAASIHAYLDGLV